jgi:hypothetical protein
MGLMLARVSSHPGTPQALIYSRYMLEKRGLSRRERLAEKEGFFSTVGRLGSQRGSDI